MRPHVGREDYNVHTKFRKEASSGALSAMGIQGRQDLSCVGMNPDKVHKVGWIRVALKDEEESKV